MLFPVLTIKLPDWVNEFLMRRDSPCPDLADRMRLVVELARWNVDHGLNGPFAAAVFERDTGRLVALGVNLVLSLRTSLAHAELVALALAQQIRGNYDLGSADSPPCELVTSTEPCAMCLGAIPWSGVRSLICGARDVDARAIGFDEGHKPRNWVAALGKRGIAVRRDILRPQAVAVLRHYVACGGIIYNPS
jgi:tRNA(Arg) A34 adenosine deaminase TadA